MNIERLPSGTYRVRKTINKKTCSILFKHKPTKHDIDYEIAKLMQGSNSKQRMSLDSASSIYIEAKANVLSPSTIREYRRKQRNFPYWISEADINSIDNQMLQRYVNEISVGHSPKTVKDSYAFITSILLYFGISNPRSIVLPQRIKKEPYCPNDEDIRAIIAEAKGTAFECAIGLAVCGLRRSEICALTADDVSNNVAHINKALVQDDDKQWIIKTTKTTESTREVPIPKELADKIIEQGKAYDRFPGSISNWLVKAEKRLGLKHFSVHMLRHYFASKLFLMGYSKREIEKLGGWEKNSQVLEEIYTQCMIANTDKGRRDIMSRFTNDIFL